MIPRRVGAVAAVTATLLAVAAGALAATDPYRASQWGLERIAAPASWAVSQGDGEIIAVIDSGVDLDHPDLVDRLLRDRAGNVVGWDYIDGDAVPQDRNGHGTMVAGIALATADNGVGIAGVAPAALLLPVRVLDAEGRGSASHVDAAIRWAVDNGATVVNLSLESVAPLPGTIVSQAPEAAVRYAWERGVAVVAAAGNSGSGFTDYDDASPVLLVGATDREDRPAAFSDRGRTDAVLAPGVGIVSTWCDPTPGGCDEEHRYGQADGTSFAAPSVAGALAVLLGGGRSAEEAVDRLRETAVDLGAPGPDARHGHGRIDLAAAVSGTPAEASTPTPAPETTAAASGPADEPPSPAEAEVGDDADGPPSEPAIVGGPATATGEVTTSPAPTALPDPGERVTPVGTPPDGALGASPAVAPGGEREDLLRFAAALLVLAGAVTWERVRRVLAA